jgi:hypothetical protein
MAIRNRFLAFFYRLLLLGIGGYGLWILFAARALTSEASRGIYFFDCQTLLVAVVVILCEVIANAIGLSKKTNGIVPGVWSPIFLASLSFVLFESIIYPCVCLASGTPYFGAYERGPIVMILSKIVIPALMLGDYLLFGEKGTVKWKHPIFWSLYPLFYFAFCLLVQHIFDQQFTIVKFFTAANFASANALFSGNGGWNGVVLSCFAAWLGYIGLAYLMVFLNFVYAGAYRKRTPADVI